MKWVGGTLVLILSKESGRFLKNGTDAAESTIHTTLDDWNFLLFRVNLQVVDPSLPAGRGQGLSDLIRFKDIDCRLFNLSN
jgi:hypothetical protein